MRILQLTNYPTVNPMHGGQIRAAQMAKALRDEGHDVQSLAIFFGDHFSEAAKSDIKIASNPVYFRDDLTFVFDYLVGTFALSNRIIHEDATRFSNNFSPELIIVEQPWLFRIAKIIARKHVKVIYSSQNIEWRLKRDIFPVGFLEGQQYIDDIRELEREAASSSDLVIACTQADADDLYTLSKKYQSQNNIIVCGNGVEPFNCTTAEVNAWRSHFRNKIGAPHPVFVSSGHLPNAMGFWNLLAPGLTFLRPDEQVLVVGGVCGIISNANGIEPYRDLNLSRLHLAGTRPKRELQAMVRASHVVMLPIATGEGSNLKTAEALESGCSIVGTSKAFRGFEEAMQLPNVSVADTAIDFRRAIRSALIAPRNDREVPVELRSKFYWSSQMKPIVNAINSMDI